PPPGPLFPDQPAGRASWGGLLPQPVEIDAFVLPSRVESALGAEARLGDGVEFTRQLEDPDPAKARLKRFSRHVAVEEDAFLEARALDQIPGGIESVGRVEDSLYQG